jgi:hypothetical protein
MLGGALIQPLRWKFAHLLKYPTLSITPILLIVRSGVWFLYEGPNFGFPTGSLHGSYHCDSALLPRWHVILSTLALFKSAKMPRPSVTLLDVLTVERLILIF